MDRAVHGMGEIRCRTVSEVCQVGAADVADEHRIAGEDRGGFGIRVLTHQDADRFPRVTGCRQNLQVDCSEGYVLAVCEAADRVFGFGCFAESDPGPGRLDEFEVSGYEVGVEMGVDDASMLRPRRSASVRYSPMSRRGSTTIARPVVSSPIRYDACERHWR